MRFDGTNWSYVGLAGFSTATAHYVNLSFGPSGIPYVAYGDDAVSHKVTVKQFDGSAWISVGQDGFSTLDPFDISLAISSLGDPWVAYSTSDYYPYHGKGSVMQYNGSDWVYVGPQAFTSTGIYNSELVFSPADVPYLAYIEYNVESQLSVMRYSPGLGMNEHSENRILIYPNPAIDFIYMITDNALSNNNVSILSIDSRELIYQPASPCKQMIDVTSLPAGVYFVKNEWNGTVWWGKFVKY